MGCVDLDKPRTICGWTIDPKGRNWVKRVLLAWLVFAVLNKVVAVYFFANLDYTSLWRNTVDYIHGTLATTPTKESSANISCDFEVTGLGNLLFQYASLYGIGKSFNRRIVVPDRLRLLTYFRLDVASDNSSRPGKSWKQYPELRASSYDSSLMSHLEKSSQDAELVGYFQSWWYFRDVIPDIKQQLTFSVKVGTNVKNILRGAMTTNSWNHHGPPKLVGIHIRRGNMASGFFARHGYTTASSEYLEKAMELMESQFHSILFVVCSDDMQWSEKNVNISNRAVYFSRTDSDVIDLALLTSCDHVIMTVGTFGWWAGFLAGGQVVFFQNFPTPHSALARAFSEDKNDYYPSEWIGIS